MHSKSARTLGLVPEDPPEIEILDVERMAKLMAPRDVDKNHIFARPVQLKLCDTLISCFLPSSTPPPTQNNVNLPETMKTETLEVRNSTHILYVTMTYLCIVGARCHV